MTGGAGYLGSVLCRKLLDRGFKVRVLDNLLYGEEPLQPLISNENFELIVGDIRDMRTLTKAINGADAVVHLAAIVGDQAGDLGPKATVEINCLATKNIAELCQLYNVRKLLFASTCTVYGSQPGKVLDENSEPAPFSLYGQTKLRSERDILGTDDLEPVIFRLGTLFGLSPRMRFDLAINLFTAKAIREGKVTVFGGNQFRPFIHVDDVATAFMLAIEKDYTGIYNLGNENVQILDVPKRIRRIIPDLQVEIKSEIQDRRDYQISSSKIRKVLGLKKGKSIEDCVREIKREFDVGTFRDYTLPKFSNFRSLFTSEEAQRKVYTQGVIF